MDLIERLLYHVSAYSAEYLIALYIITGLLALLLVVLLYRQARLLRPLSSLLEEGDREPLPALLTAVEKNRWNIEALEKRIAALADDGKHYLRYVGLVRYDAFDDIAGQQSYSLCLLDGTKSGFLVTFLTGKNFTRSYAVEIKEGRHSRKLGEEEMRAYERALAEMSSRS